MLVVTTYSIFQISWLFFYWFHFSSLCSFKRDFCCSVFQLINSLFSYILLPIYLDFFNWLQCYLFHLSYCLYLLHNFSYILSLLSEFSESKNSLCCTLSFIDSEISLQLLFSKCGLVMVGHCEVILQLLYNLALEFLN